MIDGGGGGGEEPNKTTAKKAWPSSNLFLYGQGPTRTMNNSKTRICHKMEILTSFWEARCATKNRFCESFYFVCKMI
jgi:hypothetical protein